MFTKKLISLALLCLTGLAAQAVTLNVQVPDGSRTCYVSGDFQGWDAANALPLTKSGTNMFTITLDDVTTAALAKGYKYLSGPAWIYVEKDASGNEIGNRTAAGNPDVVGSWYHVYNPDIQSFKISLNGYERKVEVLLPTGYENSDESYPVVYLTGVQQRFNNAGDDSDRGDDFFGALSWNIPSRLDGLQAYSDKPCIFVSVYGYFSENLPFRNDEFIGSGESDSFIGEFVNTLIPAVNSRYRTLTGSANTTLLGADVGGMLSLYAAATYPTVFGTCVSMSPLSVLNPDEMIAALATATADQRYVLTYGTAEPASVTGQIDGLAAALQARGADVKVVPIAGGTHDDDTWGAAFPAVYTAMATGVVPAAVRRADAVSAYTLCNAIDSQDLVADESAPFNALSYHKTDGSTVNARVSVKSIPASVTTKYYWNVRKGDGTYLLASNKNVSFSSKKTTVSWHRVVIHEDETVENMAASSEFFRLVNASSTATMTVVSDYVVGADITLSGSDKSLVVHYGSVNSGSDMGICSPAVTLPDDCTAATVTYNFATNELAYVVTSGGGSGDDPVVPGDTEYVLYNAIDSQDLAADNSVKFSDVTFCSTSGTTAEAKALVKEIPASVTTKYYWNVGYEGTEGIVYLKSSNGNIGFSSKKTSTSWHRVVVNADKSVSDIAASSTHFRLVTADATTEMTPGEGYDVTASATFDTNDKSVVIHYGSVNSGSDMGICSATVYAPDDCLAADVTYNFLTNRLSVTPTSSGAVIDDVAVTSMQAVPGVVRTGQSTVVTIVIDQPNGAVPSLEYNYNYGSTSAISLAKSSETTWTASLDNLKGGIYNLSLNIARGGTVKSGVAKISVKVLEGTPVEDPIVVVNAYADVDWNACGQYKANFHTHTSQSFDTKFTVSQVVDSYHNAGYSILALTDHDANPYPWTLFDVFNPAAQPRDPASLGMLAIPGVELSKDSSNSWSESTGGEFNHHNDFFTGRRGQEFASLRESYAYTYALGGMQIINHPGQYWNLSNTYADGAKNSASWHAENFRLYPSLVGLEVYNQGNRRPNDRILWDQILDMTMPDRPVWGYSNDDTHTAEQYFRNYQYMLMPSLSVDELKIAMAGGHHYFCYEYTGSGQGKCPRISNITVDKDARTITVDTDADDIVWISGTDRNGDNSTRKSTVVAVGKTFDYTGFQGCYVRALVTNDFGQTCTQPFGIADSGYSSASHLAVENASMAVFPCPAVDLVNVVARGGLTLGTIRIYDLSGNLVLTFDGGEQTAVKISVSHLASGVYVVNAAGASAKLIKR